MTVLRDENQRLRKMLPSTMLERACARLCKEWRSGQEPMHPGLAQLEDGCIASTAREPLETVLAWRHIVQRFGSQLLRQVGTLALQSHDAAMNIVSLRCEQHNEYIHVVEWKKLPQ